jgi:hypothetical protein
VIAESFSWSNSMWSIQCDRWKKIAARVHPSRHVNKWLEWSAQLECAPEAALLVWESISVQQSHHTDQRELLS